MRNCVDPTRTHSLKILFVLWSELDARFEANRRDCEWLENIAVDSRYPDAAAEPSEDDVDRAVVSASRLFEFVSLLLSNEVRP